MRSGFAVALLCTRCGLEFTFGEEAHGNHHTGPLLTGGEAFDVMSDSPATLVGENDAHGIAGHARDFARYGMLVRGPTGESTHHGD